MENPTLNGCKEADNSDAPFPNSDVFWNPYDVSFELPHMPHKYLIGIIKILN